jgi:esterase/lipase superfamily enzyme
MSGTYDLGRFFNGPIGDDFALSSAARFLGGLDEAALDRLRDRFVVLASGEGANENIGESWAVAHALGSQGVPNRVDPWGRHWEHDWPLWRAMLPQYLDELT